MYRSGVELFSESMNIFNTPFVIKGKLMKVIPRGNVN